MFLKMHFLNAPCYIKFWSKRGNFVQVDNIFTKCTRLFLEGKPCQLKINHFYVDPYQDLELKFYENFVTQCFRVQIEQCSQSSFKKKSCFVAHVQGVVLVSQLFVTTKQKCDASQIQVAIIISTFMVIFLSIFFLHKPPINSRC